LRCGATKTNPQSFLDYGFPLELPTRFELVTYLFAGFRHLCFALFAVDLPALGVKDRAERGQLSNEEMRGALWVWGEGEIECKADEVFGR